jgi:hypothetical protein
MSDFLFARSQMAMSLAYLFLSSNAGSVGKFYG